jgi:hypothetical protein
MAVLFYTLTVGRPMLEFENMKPLLIFLGCPKLPRTHWSNNGGWRMAEHMDRWAFLQPTCSRHEIHVLIACSMLDHAEC